MRDLVGDLGGEWMDGWMDGWMTLFVCVDGGVGVSAYYRPCADMWIHVYTHAYTWGCMD